MGTKIEWVKNQDGTKGETWNPIVGCTKTSPGCEHCYAEKMAFRLAHMALADIEADRDPGRKRHYLDVIDLERRCWNGKIALAEDALTIPLHWRKPRTVFVCSMGDLFHDAVPFEFIERIYSVMAEAKRHTFVVLTKRPKRAAEFLLNVILPSPRFLNRADVPLIWKNVIGMVTAENQEQAEKRIPWLLKCPFRVRGVSIEPMLGPIDLDGCVWWERVWEPTKLGNIEVDRVLIDWVIVGGETGPGARPMCPQWVRNVRDQCKDAGIAFFFKAWGSYVPATSEVGQWIDAGWDPDAPKHGRVLDGREWNETPGGQS